MFKSKYDIKEEKTMISLRVNKKMVDALDEIAHDYNRSRGEVVRYAAEKTIEEYQKIKQPAKV